MKKIALYSSLCLILGACASIVDHQSVFMTVKTPGAENARCTIENRDHKYVAYTDETVEVMKSPYDLLVRCLAPGNREKTVHVKREVSGWVFLNVTNGFVPGTVYDFLSRGGFDYPNVVTVSFAGEPIKPYSLPAYEAKDLRSAKHGGAIEYMGPGTMVTEENRYDVSAPLQKKTDLYGEALSFETETVAPSSASYSTSRPAVSYDPTEEDK